MLGFGAATRVYLAVGATDMRKGFEGLFGLVKHRLAENPLSGHLFVFCNRPRTRIKMLFWDGSGLWICAKRLEKGRFSWPEPSADPAVAKVSLQSEQLALLLGGIELTHTRQKTWWRMEAKGGETS